MPDPQLGEPGEIEDPPIFCDRCLRILLPGRGEFFEVKIKGVADPSPPDLDAYLAVSQDQEGVGESVDEIVKQMDSVSAREAMDEVIRRVKLTMCNDCFRIWIEDPAGRA